MLEIGLGDSNVCLFHAGYSWGFDGELKRGVRRRYLPEPNPQRVELPRNAKLRDIYEKVKQLYFNEVEPDIESMCLCDSSGLLIPISDVDSWTLASFYSKNNLQPSRCKLYVTVRENVSMPEEIVQMFIVVIILCYRCRQMLMRTIILLLSLVI